MKLKNKHLYIPIIILFTYLIIRLINQANLISIFPLDITNDISSLMARLHFLKIYGYHNLVPNWYNGFILFQSGPPMWFFLTLPIYEITNNIQLTSYIALISTYLIALILFMILRKLPQLNKTQSITFFLLFLANAIAIGNFIRLTRLHELLAWTLFIPLAFIILHYKNKKLDKKFYISSILYALIILTHQNTAVLTSLLFLSIFLIKPNKEKLKIIFSFILSLIFSAFWTVPYIKSFFKTQSQNLIFTRTIFRLDKNYLLENIGTIIVPLTFMTLFYFYYKNKSRKELLFYSPLLLLNILLLTRLIYWIPILKMIAPDSIILLSLFFSIYFLLKTEFNIKIISKTLPYLLILICILSIAINIIHTPQFTHQTELGKQTLSILPEIENRFIILGSPDQELYSKAIDSYAAIYHNLSTSSGWYQAVINKEYADHLINAQISLNQKQCETLIQELKYLNTTDIISFNEHCTTLKDCKLKQKINKENLCLYITTK